MEARVRERLVGALVLVAIVVLFVPAILKGRDPPPAAAPEAAPVRRIELPIGDATPVPEEQVLVPEPAQPAATSVKPQASPLPTPEPTESRAPPPPPAMPATEPRPATVAPRTPETGAAPVAPAPAWAVQLGAFSNKAKADQLVAELRKRRFAAFVLEYRAGGQVLYRVRVGPEQDRARAEATAARLRKEGFEPVVARHP